MSMPLWFGLARHGYSLGNWANDLIRAGRYDEIPEELHGAPIWRLCLTSKGIMQAKAAGAWLDQYVGLDKITAAFRSPFIRAIETASHIMIPGNVWRENGAIRERSWGDMDHIPTPAEYEVYQKMKLARRNDPLGWLPPNGEQIMALPDRLTSLLGTLNRQHSKEYALCVMHGESITALKMALERIPWVIANEMIIQKNPILHIPNCGISEYTRINPEDPSDIREHLMWAREIDPMNPPANPDACWRKIDRSKMDCAGQADLVRQYGIGHGLA